MPLTTARPWLFAVLLAVLVFLSSSAFAGMTPFEVKRFEDTKAKAEIGDPKVQNFLAHCYEMGWGVAKDEVEAFKWFRKAADQGIANSQNSLGFCYFNGRGVAKDMVEGAKWYRKAADQGNTDAQSNLGVCYWFGEGVAKDMVEAYAYFITASIKDNHARHNRDTLRKELSSTAVLRGNQRAKQLQKEIDVKIAAK